MKLCILDLDGVLLDSRDMHYHSLNEALRSIDEKYVISRDEHLSRFDGLSTTVKLNMLEFDRGFPKERRQEVWEKKQEATWRIIRETTYPSPKLIEICKYLISNDYIIGVFSNAVRKTIETSLECLGIGEYIFDIVSNEDVKNGKPYPEGYWKLMIAAKVIPKDTLILEDSHIGRQGAIDSGGNLLPIENSNDLTLDKVRDIVEKMENPRMTIPWKQSNLNVLIPMAGAGSRFVKAGYTFPKPLIEVLGKPMIQLVLENLNIDANYIFLVQKEHYNLYSLNYLLPILKPNCKIVLVDGLTEGAACTTLLAKEHIDNNNPLLICNSDQYLEWNSNEVMYTFNADEIDGGILTFEATHPKWSYAKLDVFDRYVVEVAEKKVISTHATCGVYFWKKGSDYCKYTQQMIDKNIRTNDEFYVAPVYNEAVLDKNKIKIKNIERMWGIGTPEDLETFLRDYNNEL